MEVVNLAVFKNDQVLLVRDREGDYWTLPGGKKENGESDKDTLYRELKEELPFLKWRNERYLGEFYGITPHSKEYLKVRLFVADLVGGIIRPGAEVTESKWVPVEFPGTNVTTTTRKVINNAFCKHL